MQITLCADILSVFAPLRESYSKARIEETFYDEQIVSTLRRQLTWTHQKTVRYCESPIIGIRMAEYMIELPPKELLSQKLQRTMVLTRERLALDVEEKKKPTARKAAKAPRKKS